MVARSTVNIGLVGYKFMGKAHSNAYRQAPRFFPETTLTPVLKAICGRDEAQVREAAGVLGWESWESDWRALIARDDIDIVDVATPGNLHAEIAIAAATAGKHVFCEKPLANDATHAKAMLDAAVANNVKHAIFFNYRKVPAVALAYRLIGDGVIGHIHHWRATYLQDWLTNPNAPLAWRLQKESAGSGAHGDLNSHLIDLARYLVGEIAEVSGAMQTFIRERPERRTAGDGEVRMGPVTVDDAVIALARFENGALGTFEASRFALGRKNYNRFEINGSKGSIAFNLERINELEIYTEDTTPGTHGFRTVSVTTGSDPYSGHYWPAAHNLGYEHTFVHLVSDALEAIAHGDSPSPNFYDGYANNVILDSIEKSSITRCWEPVRA